MWEIGSAKAGSQEARKYLKAGWEPYAVVYELSGSGPGVIVKYRDYTGTSVIWFRREKKKKP
ncbi:MAG: hypothetical protein PHI12_06770 [Dehalococcoidales bacterium]|nr:hypothetical protein [Dehalococcoidales bacterium]